MNRRLTALVASLVVAGAASPGVTSAVAKAKPKPRPVCLMLTDTPGDAKVEGQGDNHAIDDIISADIVTGKKTIVGVLRLASGDPTSGIPTGETYKLQWTQTQKGKGGGVETTQAAFFFYINASGGNSAGYGTSADSPTGPSDDSGSGVNAGPTPQATIDPHGVITWVLSRKDAGVTSGAKFSRLTASSKLAINFETPSTLGSGSSRFSGDSMDDATGHLSYTDMQQSCVRAN